MAKKSINQQILDNQKKILKKLSILDDIQKEIDEELKGEKRLELKEEEQIDELERLEQLESKLEEDVKVKPLTKITYRDFSKSAIGATFGILGHFAFFYGIKISHFISMGRATFLYVISFLIGAMFLYFTGYRKSKTTFIKKILPLRLLIIYITSIAMIIIILYLFNFAGNETNLQDLYKIVATTSILAVMGAVTADLIGKEE